MAINSETQSGELHIGAYHNVAAGAIGAAASAHSVNNDKDARRMLEVQLVWAAELSGLVKRRWSPSGKDFTIVLTVDKHEMTMDEIAGLPLNKLFDLTVWFQKQAHLTPVQESQAAPDIYEKARRQGKL